MTQEDKDLLLKDLCARLPYGVIMTNRELPATHYPLTCEDLHDAMFDDDWDDVPYLRPMSSMTEEEHNEWFNYYHEIELKEAKLTGDYLKAAILGESASIDWLNKNMFDYRGLIEKGLAIEVTENNNPYKD